MNEGIVKGMMEFFNKGILSHFLFLIWVPEYWCPVAVTAMKSDLYRVVPRVCFNVLAYISTVYLIETEGVLS